MTFDDAALQARVTALVNFVAKGVQRVVFLDALAVDRQLGKLLQGVLDGSCDSDAFTAEIGAMSEGQKCCEKLGIAKFCDADLKKEIDFAKVLRESFLESINSLPAVLAGAGRLDAAELTSLCEEMEAIEVATCLEKRIFIKNVYYCALPDEDHKRIGTKAWKCVSKASLNKTQHTSMTGRECVFCICRG